jgi:hypothetical protein
MLPLAAPVAATAIMLNERDFPGRRWVSIALRTVHLAGVVLAAVGVVDGGAARLAAGFGLMLVSGLALYAIDLWHHPDLWREVAGVFVALKLITVVAMLLVPGLAAVLFWLLLVASSIVSHAPHAFRHTRILG